MGAGSSLDLDVTATGVPAAAAAVVLNLTVADATAGSYLTLWPAGQALTRTSDLNFGPQQTVANLVVVRLGSSGRISIYNDQGATDAIADVTGWYS